MSPSTWFRTVALFAVVAIVSLIALISQPDAQARDETKGRKHALLVGVKEYKGNDFATLKYTERDVEELEKILTKSGYQVRLLTTAAGKKDKADVPTAENIRKAFTALIKARGKGDTVLLALSGHGLQIEVKDPKGEKDPLSYGYFCPQDADTTDIKYSNGYSDHLILVDDLMEGMGKCQATSKLMLMDACRNEISRTASSRNVDVQSAKVPRGVAVLFSCSREQKAWEHDDLKHGVFFHFVLEGLRGKAKNEDEEVTWDMLSAYVKGQVHKDVPKRIRQGAKQTPHGVNNVEGDPVLLLVPKDGGKKEDNLLKTLTVEDKANGFEMEFVLIPATGKDGFMMGSPNAERLDVLKAINETKEPEWLAAESPQHKVVISQAFYMGKFEVTQKQYKALMGTNPSYFSSEGGGKESVKNENTDNFPVETVSWDNAQTFLVKLTALGEKQGLKLNFRLPREAEWEYTCRGGGQGVHQKPFNLDGNPTDSISSSQANFDGNYPFGGGKKGDYLQRTCKVGSYKPNSFGVCDMHGNVWEWCEDWYDKSYYSNSPESDPKGPTGPLTYRSLRGGSYYGSGRYCRAAYRGGDSPDSRNNINGFRVLAAPRN